MPASTRVSARCYDGASRLSQENWVWGDPETTQSTYDDDGRIKLQRTFGSADPNAHRKTETSFYYDAADVLVSYRVTGYESDGTTKTRRPPAFSSEFI